MSNSELRTHHRHTITKLQFQMRGSDEVHTVAVHSRDIRAKARADTHLADALAVDTRLRHKDATRDQILAKGLGRHLYLFADKGHDGLHGRRMGHHLEQVALVDYRRPVDYFTLATAVAMDDARDHEVAFQHFVDLAHRVASHHLLVRRTENVWSVISFKWPAPILAASSSWCLSMRRA